MKRALLFLFPLLIINISFGKPLEISKEDLKNCGVIFGAAVWKDDQPSHALYDRIKTGIDLYGAEKINCLVLSGGASTYGTHEADVMKKIALEEEVLEEDIYIDYDGVNTEATIRNLPEDVDHFVFISNDFHLGRISFMAKRLGIESFEIVPAIYNSGRYLKEDWFRFREFGGKIYAFFFVW